MRNVMIVCLLATTMLGSCTETGAAERACKAAIKSELLNPETAEFFDFKRLSEEEFLDYFHTRIERNPDSEYASQSYIKQEAAKLLNEYKARQLDTYSLRVRAEGRLGNIVTTIKICGAGSQVCDCFEAA